MRARTSKRDSDDGLMMVELRNAQKAVRIDAGRLKRQAQAALEEIGMGERLLSILLTGDGEMARLHERWMDDPSPTDVLSFPAGAVPGGPAVSSPPRILGDIAISTETAARRRPADPQAEIRRYLIHGILHLAGHDHRTKPERLRMSRQARRLELLCRARG